MERQYKGFSLTEYFQDAREGFRLAREEIALSLRGLRSRSKVSNIESLESANDDSNEVGLSYGFRAYANVCASMGLYVGYFVLNTKPRLYPSMRFVAFNYAQAIVWTIISIYAIYFVGWRLSSLLLKDFINNFQLAVSFLVLTCLTSYIFHGLFSVVWFIKNRVFTHDFVSSSFIRSPKGFQRRQMISTLLVTIVFSCLTEPAYLAGTFISFITQQNGFFSFLNVPLFLITKYSLIAGCFMGAFMVGMSSAFVPMCTVILIANMSYHIKALLRKQLDRVNYHNTTDVHNPYLLSLVNDYERRLIADYSCYSITMDWPSLDGAGAARSASLPRAPEQVPPTGAGRPSAGKRRAGPAMSSTTEHRVLAAVSNATNTIKVAGKRFDLRSLSRAQLNQINIRVAFGADALLFAYRNLIKNLNQLKDFIRAYERRFGYIHLSQIYINGLITAQWVVFGIIQIRMSEAWLSNTTELSWPSFASRFVLRAVLSITAFVSSNTIVFVRADRLPQQMAKMRSQLFRFNIELTRCAIASQRTRARDQSLVDPSDWPELEQVWILYDQAARLSRKARFRLGSNLFYDKNCLIQVFFSEVSVILVVIQIMDLYKLS